MRYALIVMSMLFWPATSAIAQVSIATGLPGVSIGINLPVYPELVQVPGHPVYYAPRLNSNFFFYDGLTGYTSGITGTRVPGTTGPGDALLASEHRG